MLQAGKYEEALLQLRSCNQAAPSDPVSLNLLGITLTKLGRLSEANENYLKALAVDPNFWVARRNLAENYLNERKVDLATSELHQVLMQAPEDPPTHLLLGQIDYMRRDCGSAVGHFERTRKMAAQAPLIDVMEAECRIHMGQQGQARKLLAALKSNPRTNNQVKFKMGWLLGRLGQYQDAIDVFQSLPQDFPDLLSHGYALALAYFELQRYEQTSHILESLRSRRLANGALLSLLGVTYDRMDRRLEALAAFEEAIRVDPKDEASYLNIAALYSQTTKYEEAIKFLSDGIEQLPEAYRLYVARGLLLHKAKRLSQGEPDFQKALHLAPDSPEVYGSLALAYIEDGRPKEAVDVLERASRLAPPDAGNQYLLAEALIKLGAPPGSENFRKAMEALEKCLELNSQFVYAYLDRGKLKLRENDTKGAIADLEKARNLKPQASDILYNLAMAHRRAGNEEIASKLFKEREKLGRQELEDYNQFMLRVLAKPATPKR